MSDLKTDSPKVSPFAIPETAGERHKVRDHRVLPEVSDEDEELLIQTPSVASAKTPFGDRFEKLFILLLFVLGALSVIVSSGDVGMAWDEAYYADMAEQTLSWTRVAISNFHAATAPDIIMKVWSEPAEHPSITRFLTAAGLSLTNARNPLWALRLPIAVCFGLSLVMLYLLVRRSYGRVSAWISVIAFFFMPCWRCLKFEKK